MDRRQRSEAVKAATSADWRRGSGPGRRERGRAGRRLVFTQEPDYVLDEAGEVIGVDAWVELYDAQGNEIPIDPHRRIINPPTVPRAGVRLRPNADPELTTREVVRADPLEAFYEAVWDSVEETPNAPGWRTRGTVTTVYGVTSDAYIRSFDASYGNARQGLGTLTVLTGTVMTVGQSHGSSVNNVYQAYIGFDTSAITDTDVVSAVELSCVVTTDSSTKDFFVRAIEDNWGPTVTSADWTNPPTTGYDASLTTVGLGSVGFYKPFTSQAGFTSIANIKTGTVYLLLYSDDQAEADGPAANATEYIQFASADTSGTTQDPKLTITHAAPPPPALSGGSTVDITVSVDGAGSPGGRGGSDVSTAVTAAGAGSPGASSGSDVSTATSSTGSGSPGLEGGSSASTELVAAGAGSPGASSGSDALVEVLSEGGGFGSVGLEGGSDALVDITADGSGSPGLEGGASSTVDITADGSGFPGFSGGSDAVVEVLSDGAGGPGFSGSSTAAVDVSADGTGTPDTSSGSDALVEVLTSGGGFGSDNASGGSSASIDVAAGGSGVPDFYGGSSALVTVLVTGGGLRVSPTDITVTVGPSRVRERVTVALSRTSLATGPTRTSLTAALTRLRERLTAGESRTSLVVDLSRTGNEVGPTRTGVAVGPSRNQREE